MPDRPTADIDPTADQSRLLIDAPDTAGLDERFVPRITGLSPTQCVSLEATATDGSHDWDSTATFAVDGAGVVDLSTTAPLEGSYDGVDAMGPIWSMTPADGSRQRFELPPLETHDVTLTAVAGGRTASATVTIRHGDPGVTRHAVDDPDLAGAWFEPESPGPHPAVLVLHGSDGAPLETPAALLASHGFAAFALQYLGTHGLPERPVEVPLEYVRRAIDRFLERDEIETNGLGVYGQSMGAQLALVLGTVDDRLEAVVADCGATAVFSGGDTAPWTVDGEPLPRIPIREEPPDSWDGAVDGAPIKRELWIQMLEAVDTSQRRAATIPLEAADIPYLFLSGSDDAIWPAKTFGNMALARLDALEYDREYDHRVYHEAGHCIRTPYRPTTWRPADGGLATGGTPAGQARAQADAWPRILEFLAEALE